jgi:hypothetical protein
MDVGEGGTEERRAQRDGRCCASSKVEVDARFYATRLGPIQSLSEADSLRRLESDQRCQRILAHYPQTAKASTPRLATMRYHSERTELSAACSPTECFKMKDVGMMCARS